MGVAEGGIEVAVFLADHGSLGGAAGLELGRLAVRLQQRRQFLRLDRDCLGGVLGEIGVLGKDGRDRLADIAQPSARQHPLAIELQPGNFAQPEIDRRNVGNIGGGPHRMNASCRACFCNIDREQLGMRMRGAHDAHVQLPRKHHIGRKARLADEQRPVLQPGHPPADELFLRLRHDRFP